MKKLKILVIDCNPVIHIGLKSIFKNSVIFEVYSYLEDIDLLIDTITKEKIDFIISEVNINGITAVDILKTLKKNKIDIPLVIFTSISNENKSLKLLKTGASGFLTKNLKKRTIRSILQDLMPYMLFFIIGLSKGTPQDLKIDSILITIKRRLIAFQKENFRFLNYFSEVRGI